MKPVFENGTVRHIWEIDDIVSGMIVVRCSAGETGQITRLDFAASVAYKIGYLKRGKERLRTFVSLTDGWTKIYDDAHLIGRLNDGGYRPVSKDEAMLIFGTVNNGFH